jgi:hypothetical protein
MTYSERDLMRVFFKRITACLFDSSEKRQPDGLKEAQNRQGCVTRIAGIAGRPMQSVAVSRHTHAVLKPADAPPYRQTSKMTRAMRGSARLVEQNKTVAVATINLSQHAGHQARCPSGAEMRPWQARRRCLRTSGVDPIRPLICTEVERRLLKVEPTLGSKGVRGRWANYGVV